MSLKTNIDHHEKAFGSGAKARFDNARLVAGIAQDADPSPAYEGFRAGNRDAPPMFPKGRPERFDRTPLTSTPFSGQGHRSGVNEIANNTSDRTPSGDDGDR